MGYLVLAYSPLIAASVACALAAWWAKGDLAGLVPFKAMYLSASAAFALVPCYDYFVSVQPLRTFLEDNCKQLRGESSIWQSLTSPSIELSPSIICAENCLSEILQSQPDVKMIYSIEKAKRELRGTILRIERAQTKRIMVKLAKEQSAECRSSPCFVWEDFSEFPDIEISAEEKEVKQQGVRARLRLFHAYTSNTGLKLIGGNIYVVSYSGYSSRFYYPEFLPGNALYCENIPNAAAINLVNRVIDRDKQ